MKVVFSIEIELLEPILVDSAEGLRELRPGQILWVSVRLMSDGSPGEVDAVGITARSTEAWPTLRLLVPYAQKTQPNGTTVQVWYQGRSESFVF